ncbi:uncharacterized protein [Littorina saxatilis]|uniref:uncharacterized protein isoform X2 n=1 Tax=Littorina saxatilis TaxID=31220 RepID=UPI0038B5F224
MFSKLNTSSGLLLIVVTCFAAVSAINSHTTGRSTRTTLTTLTASASRVAATHARELTVTTRKPTITGSTSNGTGPTPIFPPSVTKATRSTMQFETSRDVNKTLYQTLSTEPTPASGMPRTSPSGSENSGKTSDSGSDASRGTYYTTLLAFVVCDTSLLVIIIVVIVITGVCLFYRKWNSKHNRADVEDGESSRDRKTRNSDVSTTKDVNSAPDGVDNALEEENYDVVGDLGSYTSLQTVHPGINRSISMGPEEVTVEKKKPRRERDRSEGDRRREGERRKGDRREGERREKKMTSEQMELNVSSTTTTSADVTSGHVDGDDPNELYENWSGP